MEVLQLNEMGIEPRKCLNCICFDANEKMNNSGFCFLLGGQNVLATDWCPDHHEFDNTTPIDFVRQDLIETKKITTIRQKQQSKTVVVPFKPIIRDANEPTSSLENVE